MTAGHPAAPAVASALRPLGPVLKRRARHRRTWAAMTADSADVAAAKRLLDLAKSEGFAFERIAPGPDGPLRGVRVTVEWVDEVYLGGFWEPDSCSAIRRRRSSLIVPGGLPMAEQLHGDALTVLHTVVWDWT